MALPQPGANPVRPACSKAMLHRMRLRSTRAPNMKPPSEEHGRRDADVRPMSFGTEAAAQVDQEMHCKSDNRHQESQPPCEQWPVSRGYFFEQSVFMAVIRSGRSSMPFTDIGQAMSEPAISLLNRLLYCSGVTNRAIHLPRLSNNLSRCRCRG